MADPFTILIQNLNQLGFYSFLLPWLFVFAVVYGLLAKANLFGGQNTRVSALLGIIIAFFVASYYGPTIAVYFTNLFGGATYILAVILVAVLFIAMSGFKIEQGAIGKKHWPIILFLIILAAIVFMVATGTVVSGIELNESAIAAVFVVVILLIAVWFVVGGKHEEEQQAGKKPG